MIGVHLPVVTGRPTNVIGGLNRGMKGVYGGWVGVGVGKTDETLRKVYV